MVLGRSRTLFPDFRVPGQYVRIFCHKAGDPFGDFVTVLFKGKMPGIEKMKLKVIQVVPVRMCALFGEDVVIFAPRNECRRLIFTKICLPIRIQRRIRAVIIKQLQLDIFVAGAIQQILIVEPVFGCDDLRIADPIGILPLGGFNGQQAVYQDIGVFF